MQACRCWVGTATCLGWTFNARKHPDATDVALADTGTLLCSTSLPPRSRHCHDHLTIHRINLNSGAESLLIHQLTTTCTQDHIIRYRQPPTTFEITDCFTFDYRRHFTLNVKAAAGLFCSPFITWTGSKALRENHYCVAIQGCEARPGCTLAIQLSVAAMSQRRLLH
jgi:hypothetical protein